MSETDWELSSTNDYAAGKTTSPVEDVLDAGNGVARRAWVRCTLPRSVEVLPRFDRKGVLIKGETVAKAARHSTAHPTSTTPLREKAGAQASRGPEGFPYWRYKLAVMRPSMDEDQTLRPDDR